jgi:hypothetical protein
MKNINYRWYKLIISVFFILLLYSNLKSQNKYDLEGMKLITSKNLIKTVKYLSSDKLEGRLAGSEGYLKAAIFITEKFIKYKIKPIKDSNYFQNFTLEYNWISAPCKLNLIENQKITKEYKLGNDFVC